MPVRRFRSVEEMNAPVWRSPGDPVLYAAIAALWRSGQRAVGHRFPPGVHKHRSMDELNQSTDAWARHNFDAYRSRLR